MMCFARGGHAEQNYVLSAPAPCTLRLRGEYSYAVCEGSRAQSNRKTRLPFFSFLLFPLC